MLIEVDAKTFVTFEDITCFQTFGEYINIMTKAPSFQSFSLSYKINDLPGFLSWLSTKRKANPGIVISIEDIQKEMENGTF